MSYNAGYDVSYDGYHYDTGCIDFPKEKWKDTFQKRKLKDRFFAYVRDNEKNLFVGYVYYQKNEEDNRYECGILIESCFRGQEYSKSALTLLCEEARKHHIEELYDNFEKDRDHTLELFQSLGFEIVEEQTWKKFHKDVDGVLVKIQL